MKFEQELIKLRQTPRILVVDDRESERIIMEKLLANLDVEVHAVSSGQEALQALIRHAYVLILLDIQMPIMGGIETARLIRSNPLTENIPVIFLTAYDKDEIVMLQGYEVGAIDYLVKPINKDILLSKVGTFLRSNLFEKEKEYEKILTELNSKNKKLKQAREAALQMANDAEKARAAEQKSKEQLEKQAKELIRYTKELEQFAYVATHDLRAPILNLEGIVRIFKKRGYVTDVNCDVFQRIENSVARVKGTLHDLIEVVAYRKLSDDHADYVDFEQLLGDTLKDLEIQVAESAAKITSDFSRAPGVSYISRHLRSIFQNLLTNALKFRSANRPLKIHVQSATASNGMVVVSVEDNGIGIETGKEDKVFGLFQRLTKDVRGKGMGLYVIRSQIESMGGEISYESTPDIGTTFRVLLEQQAPTLK